MITPERPRNIDIYTPRRVSTFSRGYSDFVRILKFTLPLVALIIIGIVFARLSDNPQQNIADLPREEKTTPGQIELVGAKYEGIDSEGRSYTVTADKANRAMNAPDTVLFEKPLADITLQDKTWVAVQGDTGVFDVKAEYLKLQNSVTVFHDSGYELRLQDLEIDLKAKTAFTNAPVTAQGPMGSIEAKNMHVEDQGDLVVFGGPATLTIFRLTPSKDRG